MSVIEEVSVKSPNNIYEKCGKFIINDIIAPSEESQLVTPDSDYDGLSQVTVNAISSTYIGSGVTKNQRPRIHLEHPIKQ